MRIYKVSTPQGYRLVESSTKGQAINHCVGTDYTAEPVLSSELYALIQQGARVEKVEPPAKKPEGQLQEIPPTTAGDMNTSTGSMTPAASTQPSMESQGSIAGQSTSGETPLPKFLATTTQQPTHAPVPIPVAAPIAPAAPAADAGWQAPAPRGDGVAAVLSEQARINPKAAAAAGVGMAPRPILQKGNAQDAEAQWQDRAAMPKE